MCASSPAAITTLRAILARSQDQQRMYRLYASLAATDAIRDSLLAWLWAEQRNEAATRTLIAAVLEQGQ